MDASAQPIDSTDLEALWNALSSRPAVPFRALGTSMRPFYPSGTLFMLEGYQSQPISLGNLVLIEVNQAAVLHRIIEIQGRPISAIITKGDSRPYPEGPYPISSIRAIATHTIENAQFMPLERGLGSLRASLIARISYGVGVINRALRKVGIRRNNLA